MPSGTIAPSPPGSPIRQRVRIPRHLLHRRSRAPLHAVRAPLHAVERLDDDSLQHIATLVPLIEHGTLASCARVSLGWNRVFAPRIGSLIQRLTAIIEEQQSDDLLRRSTLWRERRRALRASLDEPELMFDMLAYLRGFRGEIVLGPEAHTLEVAMRVTTALASTVLSATDDPSALSHVPSALLPDEQWWVVRFAATGGVAGDTSGEVFVWEALEHVDAHLERCVPWSLLARSHAWEAIMGAASAQPWFVANGLPMEIVDAAPELGALVRWSLAVMDEVGFMMMEKEAMAADAELREHAHVLRTLRERRPRSRKSLRGHSECSAAGRLRRQQRALPIMQS